jgi:hypothetical protein
MQTIETTVKHPNKENFTSRVLPNVYFERIQNLKENSVARQGREFYYAQSDKNRRK